MNDKTRNKPEAQTTAAWGSDAIAELLRALEIPYIALTPGASFRGLHDSLVNHLGNTQPELLLCVHEEHAVALAHGYARVTGRPLAVALHANVGLMHATMAIFNAWCDRIPMLMLGGVGPMDAVARRPWVDWIHTSSDMAALVRDYTKWDDPPAEAIAEIAVILSQAQRPLILIGRVANDRDSFARRVELAERLSANVITDLKTAASFPAPHPLHPFPAGIYISSEAGALVRE